MDNTELSLPAPPPVPVAPAGRHTRARPRQRRADDADLLRRGSVRRAAPRGSPCGARKRIGSALAALVALLAKFGVAIKALLVLPNLKLFVTAGTALVSVAAYSLFFGWWFAAGFVVLLFVHEMGHVIQLRREGIKATAPVFMPFLGGGDHALPDDALAEARVGLAGPILGTAGGGGVRRRATGSDLLLALAYFGFFSTSSTCCR